MIHAHTRQPALAALLAITCALGACGETNPAQPGQLKTTRVLGEAGKHNGQFVYPRGMDIFEYNGVPHAITVDKTARLQHINLETGKVVGTVHTPRWDRGKPTGLTVAPSVIDSSTLAVYVADTHEFRVLMYEFPLAVTEEPQPTEPDFQFGSFGEEPGQFVYPTDIAVETDESKRVTDIYVSEYGGNDRINHFTIDRSGEMPTVVWQSQIGVVGEEVDASDHPLAMSRPQSIELWTNPTTNQREIVVTSASHHRIGRITTDGELITWFGDPLDTSEDAFNFPYGLTILEDNTALIAEFGGNRITRIDLESGERLFRYGETGRSVGQLAQPWAVGVVGDQLVILDSGNSRLQFCDPPAKLAPEYTRPAVSPQGNTGGTP
ncbi:MAG: NHL repeat-containing protein [Phycisphaerales bacterium]